MAGPPLVEEERFDWVDGCVPNQTGWAFPGTKEAPTSVNLELLFEDSTYWFSRFCFPYGNHDAEHMKHRKNLDSNSLRLIATSQVAAEASGRRNSMAYFNEQHVQAFWAKYIVHLGWMIAMNRNHFSKPKSIRRVGGLKHGKRLLKVVQANCRLLMKFFKCTTRAGHNGRFFVLHMSQYCWPELTELSPFQAKYDAMGAYTAAWNSWTAITNQIKLGLCCDCEWKLNRTENYWKKFAGKTRPAWIVYGVLYSYFDSTCQITKLGQLCVMTELPCLEESFVHLRKWGYFPSAMTYDKFVKTQKKKYPDLDDETFLETVFENTIRPNFANLQDCLKNNIDPKHPKDKEKKFPKTTDDGRLKFLLFGSNAPRGWNNFVKRSRGAVVQKIRWKFEDDEVEDGRRLWTASDMKKHSKAWIAAQLEPESPTKPPAPAPAPPVPEPDDDSDSDDGLLD